jgi:probable HAF family extracellular repeat protein
LNAPGGATGASDTSDLDPFAPNCLSPDCYVWRPFQWKDGVLTDLDTLTEVNSGGPNDINANGVVTGISENGRIDPSTGFPEFDAVVWKNGQIINLGTFGGAFSYGAAINDRGQVAGFALNAIPDSFDLGDFCQNFPMPQQMRAFIWQNGVIQNLGTLGGTDSCALYINQRGEATGNSFTNSIINTSTGLPTIHPFFWASNEMVDLGSLGGTIATVSAINNRGQVGGNSSLVGDPKSQFGCIPSSVGNLKCHPFLWSHGALTDLGTLGGDNGELNAINDAGSAVGKDDLAGSLTHDAFLWKNGVMTDLGTQDSDPCSNALSINPKGQIVGGSSDCFTFLHAFLWENGGPMIDLNTLIPSGSGLTLTEATFINDRGEIAAQGVLPNGDTHTALLIPCDDDHPNVEECDYSMVEASVAQGKNSRSRPLAVTQPNASSPASTLNPMQNRLMRRNRIPIERPAPRD